MYSWRLTLKNRNGELSDMTPQSRQLFKVEIVENGDWRHLEFHDVPEDLTIVKIVFPAFEFELDDDIRMLLPESQGLLISNMKSHDKFTFKPENPDYVFETRFRSMKFAAVMRKEGNLMVVLRDPKCYSKSGDIYRSADRSKLFFDVVAPMAEMPFEIMVAEFDGDWFEAAQLYKKCCSPAPKLRESGRMRDIGVWLWNRDHSSWVIPPAEQLQKDSGVPVALDWYWYHKNPYDTGYPDFYPPREGVEAFSAALARLKKQGIFTQVYTNGFLWDTMNADWDEGGSEGVILDEKGEMLATAFNVFMKHPMAYMCGCADKFKQKLIEQILLLADCGLEGIYVDMIGCATMQFCYNPAHPHAPGGGCYMAEGYRGMLKELHRKRPGLYISTEDCNETYMDLVDSVISIMSPSGERYGFIPPFEFVPVFSAVHHGELTMYGSNAHIDGVPPFDTKWPQEGKWKHEEDWNSIAPEQFFVELGRSLIWGQQPMVANLRPEHLTDPKLAERYRFICRIAEFYYNNREWLYDGEMLHPGKLDCAETEVKFIVRYIFTEEGNFKTVSRVMPVVMHSVWRSPAGEKALFALNFTGREQPFTFKSAETQVKAVLAPQSCEKFPL